MVPPYLIRAIIDDVCNYFNNNNIIIIILTYHLIIIIIFLFSFFFIHLFFFFFLFLLFIFLFLFSFFLFQAIGNESIKTLNILAPLLVVVPLLQGLVSVFDKYLSAGVG